jgi:hypothetical protein
MDEMLLLPTEGVEEGQTKVFRVPWLERKERGWIKAWLSTVGMALVSPIRLMRGLPVDSPAHKAFLFAVINTLLIVSAALMPFMTLLAMIFTGLRGGTRGFGLLSMVIPWFFVLMLMIVLLCLWGLVTHGVLFLTGRTVGGLKRTFHAICYSSGANVVTAIPCMGICWGWVWWAISAVLMVKEGQRVHGGRAAFAVLTLPVLFILAVVGFYAWFFLLFVPTTMATMRPPSQAVFSQSLKAEVQVVLDGILQYGGDHSGRGPGHGVQLVTGGYISQSDMVSSVTGTLVQNVPVGNITLDRARSLRRWEVAEVEKAAVNSLPANVIAHRVGDYVFTYHGMDFKKADPGLWVVIMSPNPGSVSSLPAGIKVNIVVGQADGRALEILINTFLTKLAEQNALRAKYGLPPLPDPATVKHGKPAVGGP